MNPKLLGCAILAALATAAPAAAAVAPIVGTPLGIGTMKTPFAAKLKPGALIVESVKVAPGGNFGWHTHGSAVAVVITSGTLTVWDSSVANCAPQCYGKGQGPGLRRAREPSPHGAERRDEACPALRHVPRTADGRSAEHPRHAARGLHAVALGHRVETRRGPQRGSRLPSLCRPGRRGACARSDSPARARVARYSHDAARRPRARRQRRTR